MKTEIRYGIIDLGWTKMCKYINIYWYINNLLPNYGIEMGLLLHCLLIRWLFCYCRCWLWFNSNHDSSCLRWNWIRFLVFNKKNKRNYRRKIHLVCLWRDNTTFTVFTGLARFQVLFKLNFIRQVQCLTHLKLYICHFNVW